VLKSKKYIVTYRLPIYTHTHTHTHTHSDVIGLHKVKLDAGWRIISKCISYNQGAKGGLD